MRRMWRKEEMHFCLACCLTAEACGMCALLRRYYNAQSTPYYQCAVKVQAFMESYLDNTITKAGQPPPPA